MSDSIKSRFDDSAYLLQCMQHLAYYRMDTLINMQSMDAASFAVLSSAIIALRKASTVSSALSGMVGHD